MEPSLYVTFNLLNIITLLQAQFNGAGSDLNMRESVAPSRKNMASLKTDLVEITQVKEGAEAETASLRNMCKELGQEVSCFFCATRCFMF